MIRIAFTLIEGKRWAGGYNYLLNLVRTVSEHAALQLQPIMFFGKDIDNNDLAPFQEIPNLKIVFDEAFDQRSKRHRLCQAILTGSDRSALAIFRKHDIDLVFENAQFYGWRFPIPTLAWIPDFQHRHLRHLFTRYGFLRREIGFLAQIHSGRTVLLSSESARMDAECFYPSAKKIEVVCFAVPFDMPPTLKESRKIAALYGLPQHFFYLPNQYYRHKNHILVLQALAILKKRGADVTIVCTGKQEDPRDAGFYPELLHSLQVFGVEKNFRQLGVIPREHIPSLMRAAAAVINPSTFEGWSTTVEEAKATGTPMLLSDLPVHMEQASGLAEFFPVHNPETLADLLMNFRPISETARSAKTTEAASANDARIKAFANQFSSAALHAVARLRTGGPQSVVSTAS